METVIFILFTPLPFFEILKGVHSRSSISSSSSSNNNGRPLARTISIPLLAASEPDFSSTDNRHVARTYRRSVLCRKR